MANDIPNKTKSNSSNNSENTSPPSNIDQQKVPPLRIVLNTAGNQKSSTTTTATHIHTLNNQHKRDKTNANQDAKTETSNGNGAALKGGNKVRIKLSTGKQQQQHQSTKGGASNELSDKSAGAFVGVHKLSNNKQSSINEKQDDSKDETTSTTTNHHQGHLRRITRRSHRAVQLVSNEDEESISSMTSIDENSNTQNTTNNSDNTAPDTEQSNNLAASTSTTTNTTNATANGSASADTPRRYKRRKGEVSESQSIDNDSLFGAQNYKLPNQNSFELFRNIRKQVDKRINNLNNVAHPRAPYGFRDYMLTRGAYLLDGNKLGNGTNLFLNEDGGFHSVPIGKYHALRYNRVNYTVPNGAKVPLGLPVNSPLYDLFIEQEKERFRMRMQHIKEREKLTLAAEQEILRVYNQAALSAADQSEPLSACTMLKHQEIYNYMDADGYTILSREDTHRDQGTKPDGVRTRRRQHGTVSPPPQQPPQPQPSTVQSNAAKNLNDEFDSTKTSQKAKNDSSTNEPSTKNSSAAEVTGTTTSNDVKEAKEIKVEAKDDVEMIDSESKKQAKESDEKVCDAVEAEQKQEIKNNNQEHESNPKTGDEKSNLSDNDKAEASQSSVTPKGADKNEETKDEKSDSKVESKQTDDGEKTESSEVDPDKLVVAMDKPESSPITESDDKKSKTDCAKSEDVGDSKVSEQKETPECEDNNSQAPGQTETAAATVEPMEVVEQTSQSENDDQTSSSNEVFASNTNLGQSLSDEERKTHDKEKFLVHLQEIDDKWEQIRCDMLVRHRNEAESLHAIQKLEWEWKTKEIGACDVRTNLIIDSTLVPKLNIYSQDY